ncbi:CrcB family protein [Wenzhouxiangella sp. AB-CW3]|uniref:fluoride efflux transporter FluC n=1 Tax=Wenzhouxiangella sp. AB-CW3 TaxID=2771012 RepID=UPI00168A5B62|nr:CrcB family protein [Wenzhouxiangella sp. AB-CW3]QOC21299.1 CrcB family protein [Wenzhouxiangella sp. AB-CW3]
MLKREDGVLTLLVGLGSLIGGTLRYLLILPFPAVQDGAWPWPTLLANAIGCMVIGACMALVHAQSGMVATPRMQAAVMGGFCGGLTTFSIFSLETLVMFDQGRPLFMLACVSFSLATWMLAVWAGFELTRRTVQRCKEYE